MSASKDQDYTHRLQALMKQAAVSSFKALSRQAGVSEWQVRQLRRGQVSQMRVENLQKLSKALQISLSELLATFLTDEPAPASTAALQQEYRRLQAQLAEQRTSLMQEFQQTCLQTLEPWMRFWPTAAYKVQQNPEMLALKLLPLVRPVENLLQQWGVEAIEQVGAEVAYDPRRHQLNPGTAEPGQPVKVSHIGYQQGDKLLYRAQVKPLG
ncbi:helix-turn-helix domain-containing protein [Microcoleus sp. FACHB-68]|uniref:helix-turn-helix domain-containing protein n=1 Tax=Microcoleus sp. FACHB-68 TaxID=2692826 RepID=UPI00168658A1|nr:helix-turn-helix domain-containing protein [Microcoleus sp. FACHB-68]MBD1938141.1 helix-turn-helix domain-containing protein [Microcoleus sp. FACHB-68]